MSKYKKVNTNFKSTKYQTTNDQITESPVFLLSYASACRGYQCLVLHDYHETCILTCLGIRDL